MGDQLAPEYANAEQRRDLLEILEDRHGSKSTVVTSQVPVQKWHDIIGDPTLADAILDRLVHGAYKFKLKGESLRKRNAKLTVDTDNRWGLQSSVATLRLGGSFALVRVAAFGWIGGSFRWFMHITVASTAQEVSYPILLSSTVGWWLSYLVGL